MYKFYIKAPKVQYRRFIVTPIVSTRRYSPDVQVITFNSSEMTDREDKSCTGAFKNFLFFVVILYGYLPSRFDLTQSTYPNLRTVLDKHNHSVFNPG